MERTRPGGEHGDTVDLSGTLPSGPPAGEPEIEQTLGRYVVLEAVGHGGMGVVYRAYDPKLRREVALKVLRGEQGAGSLDTDAEARLLREARAMAKLSHPNVVPVYDVDSLGNGVFIAMELIAGETLEGWMKTSHTWQDVVEVFRAAGRGLVAAHEVGLVHRDFKPANVLLGDGRVCVTDFGLARLAAQVQAPSPTTLEGSSSLDTAAASDQLTLTGQVLGTPVYMAPEQHAGQVPDARSDQFAYCVALFEALFGHRPFEGDYKALAKHKLSGKIVTRPSRRSVPGWLDHAVRRGLAAEPDDRWPDMAALLDELTRHPLAARRRRVRALGVAGVVGLAGVGVVAVTTEADPACAGAEIKLAGVWDDERRSEVARAFRETGVGFAEPTLTRVQSVLDEHANAWVETHVAACESALVHKESSTKRLDLEMSCLGRHLQRIRTLTELFVEADTDVVARAADAVGNLPEVARCRDLDHLSTEVEPPPTAEAETIDRLRRELASARSLEGAGRLRRALAVAGDVAAAAEPIGYAPLDAEIAELTGELQSSLGDYEAAEASLSRAFFSALGNHQEQLAFEAAMNLVQVVGSHRAKREEGYQWERHARALLGRSDPDPIAAAWLEHAMSGVLEGEARYEEADRRLRDALAAIEQAGAEDAPIHSALLNSIARTSDGLGNLKDAEAIYRRVLAEREQVLGPTHPEVGASLNNLATVVEHRQAVDLLRRALALWTGVYGPDHPRLAGTLCNLATSVRTLGRLDEAMAYAARCLVIAERAFGEMHPRTAIAIEEYATFRAEAGHEVEAEAYLRRALRVREQTLGREHPETAATYANLGILSLKLGRHQEAIEHQQNAMAIWERTVGPKHPWLAVALHSLGQTLGERGEMKRAIALLERAVYISEAKLLDEATTAERRFTLALLLHEHNPRSRRAIALVEQCITELRGRPEHAERVTELESWLASVHS